jgi:hypothetical protein
MPFMPCPPDRHSRLAHRCACLLAALAMAGCQLLPAGRQAQPAALPPAPVAPAPVVEAPPPPPPPEVVPDPIGPVLGYADQVRGLQGNELQQEIARFTDLSSPEDQIRLAMVLVQTRQLYDLVKAQDLLQRVLGNPGARARPLHPLARLLAARYAEQRRVEDQLDRQGAQLRDAQRRLEQTNDKLEALKEIERSLGRAAPAPALPASASRARPRPATP